MKRRISFASVILSLIITTGQLSACGQKGDLYLPAPQQPELIVEQDSIDRHDQEDGDKKKEDR